MFLVKCINVFTIRAKELSSGVRNVQVKICYYRINLICMKGLNFINHLQAGVNKKISLSHLSILDLHISSLTQEVFREKLEFGIP